MTSIGVIKMINNHLYIPTTRLYKERRKRKGSEYKVFLFKGFDNYHNFIVKYFLLRLVILHLVIKNLNHVLRFASGTQLYSN